MKELTINAQAYDALGFCDLLDRIKNDLLDGCHSGTTGNWENVPAYTWDSFSDD